MPLNIKNAEAHVYAKELSEILGKSITEAVTLALKEALEKAKSVKKETTKRLIQDLDDIAEHCASLPVLDSRTPREILGYNEIGVSE